MRRALLALIVLLCLIFFGRSAAAAGFLDYGLLTMESGDQSAGWLRLGGDFALEPLVICVTYGRAINWDPALPAGQEMDQSLAGVYGAERLVQGEILELELLIGYYQWSLTQQTAAVEKYEATAVTLGARAEIKFGLFSASLLYLYGVANDFRYYLNGEEQPEMDNPDFSLCEVNLAIQFNEETGVHLFYTWQHVQNGADEYGSAGFGLGLQTSY